MGQALARGLMPEPMQLFIDEPTLGLGRADSEPHEQREFLGQAWVPGSGGGAEPELGHAHFGL